MISDFRVVIAHAHWGKMLFVFLRLFMGVWAEKQEYCAPKTCYEILNVRRDADTNSIRKAFRKISATAHPDVSKDSDAVVKFYELSNAYEILLNKRQEYDEYLKEYEYYIKHSLYKEKLRNLFDIKIVIATTVIILSWSHIYLLNYRYQKVLEWYATNQKYRNLAFRRYRDEMQEINPKMLNSKISLSDSQIQEYIEKTPEFYLIYPKPTWKSTLVILLLSYPVEFILQYSKHLYHYVKCKVLNYPMDERDKIFFTCQALKIKVERFDKLDEYDKQYYIEQELWIEENRIAYFETIKMEERKKLADSGKAKAFMRFMKNGGYGRMSFED